MRILSIGVVLALSGCKKREHEPVGNNPAVNPPQQQQGLETESQLVSGDVSSASQTGGSTTQSLKGANAGTKPAATSTKATDKKKKTSDKAEKVATEDQASEEETEDETPASTDKTIKKKPTSAKRVIIIPPPAREPRAPFERKPLVRNPAFFDGLTGESPFDKSGKGVAAFNMKRAAMGDEEDSFDAALEQAIEEMRIAQSALLRQRKAWNTAPSRRSAEVTRDIRVMLADFKLVNPMATSESVVEAETKRMDLEIARIDTCIGLADKLITATEDLSEEEYHTIRESCAEILDALYAEESDEDESSLEMSESVEDDADDEASLSGSVGERLRSIRDATELLKGFRFPQQDNSSQQRKSLVDAVASFLAEH